MTNYLNTIILKQFYDKKIIIEKKNLIDAAFEFVFFICLLNDNWYLWVEVFFLNVFFLRN